MLSLRKTWLAALGLILAVWAALPSNAAPAPVAKPTRLDAAKLMPADTEMVMVVNVRQLLDSPLIKTHGLEPLKAALANNAETRKMLAAAGLDPLKDIDGIMLTNAGGAAKGKVLAIVRGSFDLDRVFKTAADYAEKKPGELKITKEGTLQVYEMKSEGKPAFAAFANRTTLIVSPSREYTLKNVRTFGKRTAVVNKAMASAMSKVGGKEGIWLAVVITDEMRKGLQANPQTSDFAEKLEYVTGSLDVGKDADLKFRIQTGDAKVAALITRKINDFKMLVPLFAKGNQPGGKLVADLIDSLKVGTDEGTVRLSLKFTESMVENAKKLGK